MKKLIRKIIDWAYDIDDVRCIVDVHYKQPTDFIVVKRRRNGELEVFSGMKHSKSKLQLIHDIKSVCQLHQIPPQNVLTDAPREIFEGF
jgi:hypothetical protein